MDAVLKKNRFVTAEGTDLIRAFFHDEVANDLTNECMYNIHLGMRL
ncbi:hypothetical protein B4110_1864 [Parageobacillus toebii]|uniref:Uncharacterized protein n=1 Tax=Parageobacillus toebii TaxID=153151 RepID=A0A150MEL7_9BACL|nr:hypothetical protein B4110_1864 [Parageobacillus toebii]